jgi:hypothetical protein
MLKHLIILVICATCFVAGCDKEIDVDNLLGRVTSVGPIYQQDDGRYTIHFSVYDRDGDPTDVTAEYRLSEGQAWQVIPPCNANSGEDCELIGGLRALGTDPDVPVQHQVAWDVPDELTGRVVQLRFRATEDVSRGVTSSAFFE